MRASRQTELSGSLPIDFVCAIMGNTIAVASKHYLQPRDEDFAKALDVKCVPFCVPRTDKQAHDGDRRRGAPTVQYREIPSETLNRVMRRYALKYLKATPKGSRYKALF
jgi:hypothetical protein